MGDKILSDTLSSGLAEVFIDFNEAAELILSEANIQVYPNPSNGIIRISSAIYNETSQIRIFNLAGSLVFERNVDMNEDVDISRLPKGLYHIRIGRPDNFVVRKIVLQ